MQNREILIYSSRDQAKYRVVTGAETLGELQDVIAHNEGVYKMVGQSWVSNDRPIDISGLTFTEGISKTQLLRRDSQLPQNVMFKGQVTNNLVMLLTNTTKNIQSGAGMDRKTAYALIKELGLAGAILEGEGVNYTRVKTDVLEQYITVARNGTDGIIAIAEAPAQALPDVKEAPHANTVNWIYDGVKSMVKESLLCVEDVAVLAGLVTELASRLTEERPKITMSDMDDMIADIE